MELLNLTNENFEAETSKGVVLVDFWAPWCAPCRMLAPVLDELAEKLEGKARVVKVNVDDAPELAQRFGVLSIPTVVLLRDGAELEKRIGVHPVEEFENLVLNA